MKKKYLLMEFVIVLLLLVLPPLAFKQNLDSQTLSFNPASVIQLLIAVALEFQYIYLHKNDRCKNKNAKNKTAIWKQIVVGFITLAALFAVSGLTLILNKAFPSIFSSKDLQLVTEKTPLAIGLYIFQLACAAWYEEELYRQFLPETLLYLTGTTKKIPCILQELSVILIFAFSHSYLGFAAVLNACLSGAILRLFCRKRCDTIHPGACSHMVYNTILFLFTLVNA